MATDLAEFVGAAVGLNLLFGVPLFPAGLITAVVAFGILALEQRGLPPVRAGHRRAARHRAARLRATTCSRSAPTRAAIAAGLVPGFAGAATACCWPPASSARP